LPPVASLEARALRWPVSRLDVAGAFGDIGVLFPIAIALITLNHLNPTAVFLAAGLTYILAGHYFRIPIAVQPFKAVAAIALAMSLPPSAIASAGLLMGILLLFVAATNLATWLAKLFSLPIVRGIQLGLGLLLAREGLRLMLGSRSNLVFGWGPSLPAWAIALGGAILQLGFRGSRRYPAALVLLIAGIVLGVTAGWGNLPSFHWGMQPVEILHPEMSELRQVLPLLVVPQFALTFGNAIVATENTAQILYGEQSRRVTVRALSWSIGIVNVITAAFQGAPLCHGSGGITAHYRFGARTSKSSYIIGGLCIFLGLFGRAATDLLTVIPTAILGVFLLYVGIQHAAYIRDILRRAPWLLIAIVVGLVSLATTNLMWGFLVGFALQGVMLLVSKARAKRA
jgi:SulP family sulfate permease